MARKAKPCGLCGIKTFAPFCNKCKGRQRSLEKIEVAVEAAARAADWDMSNQQVAWWEKPLVVGR